MFVTNKYIIFKHCIFDALMHRCNFETHNFQVQFQKLESLRYCKRICLSECEISHIQLNFTCHQKCVIFEMYLIFFLKIFPRQVNRDNELAVEI